MGTERRPAAPGRDEESDLTTDERPRPEPSPNPPPGAPITLPPKWDIRGDEFDDAPPSGTFRIPRI